MPGQLLKSFVARKCVPFTFCALHIDPFVLLCEVVLEEGGGGGELPGGGEQGGQGGGDQPPTHQQRGEARDTGHVTRRGLVTLMQDGISSGFSPGI